MRRVCAVLASVVVLSCGGDSPSTAPTSPTTPRTPTNPAPPTPVPTYAVSGVVRDDTGAPVADAQVSAGCLYCKTGARFSSTTDAAGRYSGRLPLGTWQLHASKPGFDTYRLEGLRVTGDTTFDVTLKPGVTIQGRVYEQGVGPLADARVEAISGPSAGVTTDTGPPGVTGGYSLHLLPGDYRIRVSKDGYDTVEQSVSARVSTNLDFTLKWAYGNCLQSVTPVLFDGYASAGGDESVAVNVNDDKLWTATPDQPWMEVTSPTPQRGSARVSIRILPHPAGATEPRSGAVMIRCSAVEGQNVWVTQHPDCQARLTPHADTPSVFPPSGGVGRLRITTGVAGCRWKSSSTVDWIHSVGISSWSGSFDSVSFVVRENTSGVTRTGAFVAGEQVWTVTQR